MLYEMCNRIRLANPSSFVLVIKASKLLLCATNCNTLPLAEAFAVQAVAAPGSEMHSICCTPYLLHSTLCCTGGMQLVIHDSLARCPVPYFATSPVTTCR
eukprot:1158332-Pelagomonas_calceolata.AAC.2